MAQCKSFREGTAQELVPYLLQNPHQRFRLIDLSSENGGTLAAQGRPEETQNLATVFAELIEAAKHVAHEVPLPPSDSHEVAFQDALQEKYRKMGLHR
jgi:hypothetical protein